MREWAAIYLKGLCMGAADMIPGVSGGTIALIVGIYDRLVHAIASFRPHTLVHLSRIHRAESRAAFLDDLRAMDIAFLLVLGAGIMTAVLVLSRVILLVFQAYPAHVNAFFFGLIAASAWIIYRDIAIDTLARLAVAVVGFLLAFSVSGIAAGGTDGRLLVVFFAGAIAISAMILPGISGAAILYILGQYEYLLVALRRFVDAVGGVFLGGSPDAIADAGVVIGTFFVGAFIGLLTTAKIVSWALANYRIATLGFLVSLMVGALRLPVEEIHAAVGIPDPVSGLGIAMVGILGIGAVYALDRATGSLEYA